MSFSKVLDKYRQISFSQKDKGARFERLMQAYLQTDPKYAYRFKKIWMWNDFPGKADLGGVDTGIDLVAQTKEGDYWAIQCKCFQESAIIDKPAVDSFLSTSSKQFKGEDSKTTKFSNRLWISTTNNWGPNATEAIKNQHPPVTRLNLYELQEAKVDWEKLENGIHGEASRTAKKVLKPHQRVAMDAAHEYFKKNDRGKLIMACGTGKTFNSLRIAENETKGKGLILFLVPSISLLGQTLREWSGDAEEPINAICICSDPEVSKKKTKNEDNDLFSIVDLALPASTNVKDILHQFTSLNKNGKKGMTVVFSTYQSIEVISKAQKELIKNGFGEFDMIICDEAHRTTGVTLSNEDESAFTKVHDNKFLKAKKRLYMTATPRLYSEDAKSKAAQADAVLCSMDEPKLYGEEIYRIGFGKSVEENLLTDYKVLILTLSDKDVPPAIQKMISDKESEINTDDATKLIGCINALSKQILGDEGIIKESDPDPMRRAVAFCQSIKASEKITSTYNTATEAYISSLPPEKKERMVSVASKHIDGTMSAPKRDELLGWLKEDTSNNECRILTNVRCLSEGVDVPSLDAVLFLSARNSQVDVVQSVGRVMRKSPGKEFGYIIIPIVIPSNVDPSKALDDNERYKVVWTVLNALRAHDDRFNASVNQIELNKNRPKQILVVGTAGYGSDESESGKFSDTESPAYGVNEKISRQLAIQFEQLQHVVFAKMVQKVGDRRYWEQWAKSVAEIAQKHEDRIVRLVKQNEKYKKAFDKFIDGLRKNINPNVTEEEAIEMLSQHIITAPVFEALFEGYSFVKSNPISVSMQKILDLLEEQSLEKENKDLEKFYESVRKRAAGIDNAEGKQQVILELYEKYFKTSMPKLVDKLGIVYTPVEVVDFIIHSVNDVLKKEFDKTLGDKDVHILDPFTGTGTFIARLIQSGLIDKKDLPHKYKNEIFANEIVLLAYYIAAVNIENAYHDAMGESNFTSFDGICLTDTFQLGESDGNEKMFSEMFPQNSDRVAKQKKTPVRIIIGNPPYSVGQKSENDNAQNQKYEKLDSRIEQSYAKGSKASSIKALYDAYIKAFRWSSDRLAKSGGIICFVSNSGWIEGNGMDGLRNSLENEFSSIYVFNLRGNQRTSGELSRKEGGKIFGSGSRTPIAISLFIKNPNRKSEKATIKYFDIGDYLNREEKLSIIKNYFSIANSKIQWRLLKPNQHGDWISQRNESFSSFFQIEPVTKFDLNNQSFFIMESLGVNTSRDAWCYNFSKAQLKSNINTTIDFFNKQVKNYKVEKNKNNSKEVSQFIKIETSKISWDAGLKNDLKNINMLDFSDSNIYSGIYRPFCKQFVYFDNKLNARQYQNKRLFPDNTIRNPIICVSSIGSTQGLSVLITSNIANLHFNGDSHCFPLFYYEDHKRQSNTLFDEQTEIDEDSIRRDGISDFILECSKKLYGKNVTKEDLFYYVYGFLHSPEYRETFANDLKKMLPRLPLVEDVKDFWYFSKAGRALAELHINYEKVPAYKGVKVKGASLVSTSSATDAKNYIVEKMRFPRKDQKDTIIYNSKITIENIPAKAYEYVVNGKSAIEWIMERYQVTTHKESGITNDPNDWAKEVENPRYILDLLLSVINLSVQTVDIVNGLPKVSFEVKQNEKVAEQ